MSAQAFGDLAYEDGFDPYSPEHVAAIVAWLASSAARGVTGHVIVVHGKGLELLVGWRPRKRLYRDATWTDNDLLDLRELLFGNESPRAIPLPIKDLFVSRGRASDPVAGNPSTTGP